MKVTVLLFARLKREAGTESVTLDLPEGSTVRDVSSTVEERFGLSLRGCMAAVNEQYSRPDTALNDGDEVAFLPPVAGGSDDRDNTVKCVLTPEPLSLAEAQVFVTRPEWGAQAFFVGTVRSPNKGVRIAYLEYEAYPPMAERVMRESVGAADARFGIGGVYIAHRTGRVTPGEASIIIGVGSPHRRAALEACDLIIEHLKAYLPVWKLEVGENGAHWVEGTTSVPTL